MVLNRAAGHHGGPSKVDATTSGVVRRICQAELIVVDHTGMLLVSRAEGVAQYRLATPPTSVDS